MKFQLQKLSLATKWWVCLIQRWSWCDAATSVHLHLQTLYDPLGQLHAHTHHIVIMGTFSITAKVSTAFVHKMWNSWCSICVCVCVCACENLVTCLFMFDLLVYVFHAHIGHFTQAAAASSKRWTWKRILQNFINCRLQNGHTERERERAA